MNTIKLFATCVGVALFGFYSMTEANDFIVSLTEEDVQDAIAESQRTLETFRLAFEERDRMQTDFVVIYLEKTGKNIVPVGMRITKIMDGEFIGRTFSNDLPIKVSNEELYCKFEDVVDWRYTDTFEMEGGTLFQTLYSRLDEKPYPKFRIRDKLPFVITRLEPVDRESRQFFRDIANWRVETVQRKLISDPSIGKNQTPMPHPLNKKLISENVHPRVRPHSAVEYVIQTGSRELLDVFTNAGIIEVPPCSEYLINSATMNLETTQRLVELGCDINYRHPSYGHPLSLAVRNREIDIVRFLLQNGANPNCRDNGGQTPLFVCDRSEIAKLLVEFGANIHTADDLNRKCKLQSRLKSMRKPMDSKDQVLELLDELGALLAIENAQTEERIRREGRKSFMHHLEATGESDEKKSDYWHLFYSVQFGAALPVRGFRVSAK